MRRLMVLGIALGVSMAVSAAPSMNNNSKPLATEKDKVSYALGIETGKAFKTHNVEINPEIFTKGLQDGIEGKTPLLSNDEIKQVLQNFQEKTAEKIQKKLQKTADENKKISQTFLANNKKKPGIITLSNGIQYKVIEKGSGAKPTLKDTVKVNYEGKLIDGKVFDSSYKRKQPAIFPVSGVIKGWQIIIPLMRTGATWEVYIPPYLAYGERGVPGLIGPNQVLIFKIHLISVKK